MLGDPQDGMITLTCCVFEGGGNIFVFEIRIILKDFFTRNARGEQFEDVFDPYAQAANAGFAAADVRINLKVGS